MKKHIYFYLSIITLVLLHLSASAQKTVTLNGVSITADSINHRNDSAVLNSGQSIGTLTQEDFERNSGLSLQNSLNLIPGVDMTSRTPWGGQHIIIRGYYPSADNGRTDAENFNGLGYTMYIDNIPVTDATGTTILDDVDFANVGRVDVVKEPSPLYGSYIAGSVNVFTPTGTPGQTTISEQAIGGSYGLFRNDVTLQTTTDNSDIWVNYGHQTYAGFRTNDGSQKDYANFAGTFKVSPKQTISTYFSYSHSYEGLGGEIDSSDFYARIPKSDSNYVDNQSHVTIESFRAGVTDKYQLCKNFATEATLFTSAYTLNQYFAHGFTLDNDLNFGGRAAFDYTGHTGNVTINGTLGTSFQKSDQASQGNFILPFVMSPFYPATSPDFPSDANQYAINYNIFTNWVLHLPSQITATIGGSLNFNEFGTQNLLIGNGGAIYAGAPWYVKSFTPAFTPDISLVKVFSKEVSIYANVGWGYCPATVSEMINSAGKIDTALKPETAMEFELGTKGSLLQGLLNYQFDVYDMDITNRITSETANSITFYTNVGEQRNMGAELALSYNIIDNKNSAVSLLRPWVSYSYINAEYVTFNTYGKSSTGGDTVLNSYNNNKVAGVAPNIFNAGLDVETKVGFYLYGTFQYVDKVPVTFDNENYMKAYNLLGAKIGYRKTFGKKFTLDVFAGIENALSSTYYSFIFVGQNIQELAQAKDGGGGDGYILPAPYSATFYGGIKLSYRF